MINEGKSDGSIRTDLDTMSITYSAKFLITGFFHMLSVSGKIFTNHFSLNKVHSTITSNLKKRS